MPTVNTTSNVAADGGGSTRSGSNERSYARRFREILRRAGLLSGVGRVSIVVIGALAVLESSQDIGLLKIAFLGVAVVLVLASALNVLRMRQSTVVSVARPWLIASAVLLALIVISLPVAVARGTSISAWLRDATAYGLFAAAPWLAIDLALSACRRAVLALTVFAGAAAAASYAVVWLEKRHIADLAVDRLALPSIILATALFAVALAISLSTVRYRYLWAAAASLTLGTLVVSGSRQSLVLLAVCPVLLLASWGSDRASPLRPRLLVATAPVLVALAIVGVTQIRLSSPQHQPGAGTTSANVPSTAGGPIDGAAASATSASPTPVPTRNLTERYESIGSVLAGQDASFQERVSQSRAVWASFLDSPIVGGGLGVPIPWTDPAGVLHTDNAFTADSPILVLAKFGVLGLGLVVVLVWAAAATIRRLSGGGVATREAWLATIGLAFGILLLMPFAWQLEDKGSALATTLVLAFGLVQMRDSRLASRGLDGPGVPGRSPLAVGASPMAGGQP
jgi:hypothetical protein